MMLELLSVNNDTREIQIDLPTESFSGKEQSCGWGKHAENAN